MDEYIRVEDIENARFRDNQSDYTRAWNDALDALLEAAERYTLRDEEVI